MHGTDAPRPPRRSAGRVLAGLGGVVSAGLALGAGELVAGFDPRLASPVEAVASMVIDRAPRPVERFAIETFGSHDKLALVLGTVVLSAVFGAVLGILSRHRGHVGAIGMLGFAAVGLLASLSRPGAGALAGLPSVSAGILGALSLRLLAPWDGAASTPPANGARTLGGGAADGRAVDRVRSGGVPVTRGGVASRRAFLAIAPAAAVGAALAGAAGHALRGRFSAAESRSQVTLPRATRPLPPIPPSAEVGVKGVAPFITPNADFYRVDTALIVPQVRAEDWTLRVTGMVDRPFELTYADLNKRDIVEADVTMTCVSNQVGGNLVGHARWLGVLARDLLDQAGVRSGADQLVGRSTDGYTCGFPISAALDRNCLVAIGMNGEPLPLRHGFPARLVTPGIYGYAGATKWLSELEVTTFDAFDQYWVPRGYAALAPIKPMARIDTPRSLERVAPGHVVVAGVAWAQTRGIRAVEVQVDDGAFRPAVLADGLNDDSWRQWRFGWDADPGRHTLTVRAVDGTGAVQTERRTDVVPDGASGWMSLVVTVEERDA